MKSSSSFLLDCFIGISEEENEDENEEELPDEHIG